MTSTVYLDDVRCDGSGHGGCQAGCRIYWKEAWLRGVDADVGDTVLATDTDGLAALEQRARPARGRAVSLTARPPTYGGVRRPRR